MGTPTQAYAERRFESADGLSLYYRDYGDAGSPRPPLLCLAGLTRNSKDFHDLACRYGAGRRVITLDYRGRGRSDWDADYTNYHPRTYLQDIQRLLAAARAPRVVVVGTSLGGIMGMLLAALQPGAVGGLVLNDVGPEVEPEGIARIMGYVGESPPLPSWEVATRTLKRTFEAAYPDLSDARWAALARTLLDEGPDGRPRQDYDPAIKRAIEETSETADLWPLFGALAAVPTLLLRGALSDILGRRTAERMKAQKPDLDWVEVPNRGHVPLLDEPECLEALDAFFARV